MALTLITPAIGANITAGQSVTISGTCDIGTTIDIYGLVPYPPPFDPPMHVNCDAMGAFSKNVTARTTTQATADGITLPANLDVTVATEGTSDTVSNSYTLSAPTHYSLSNIGDEMSSNITNNLYGSGVTDGILLVILPVAIGILTLGISLTLIPKVLKWIGR